MKIILLFLVFCWGASIEAQTKEEIITKAKDGVRLTWKERQRLSVTDRMEVQRTTLFPILEGLSPLFQGQYYTGYRSVGIMNIPIAGRPTLILQFHTISPPDASVGFLTFIQVFELPNDNLRNRKKYNGTRAR